MKPSLPVELLARHLYEVVQKAKGTPMFEWRHQPPEHQEVWYALARAVRRIQAKKRTIKRIGRS